MSFTPIKFFDEDRAIWLAWRHQGIGSSDAAIILGKSRFKTRQQLLLEKLSPVQPEDNTNKFIKERGNRVEVETRKYLEEKLGHPLPAVNCQSDVLNFAKASLDGASGSVYTEIKLLSSQKFGKLNKDTDGYKKWFRVPYGEIPDDYYPQVQHQMFVTGFDKCLFAGVLDTAGQPIQVNTYNVPRNDEYIKKLMQAEFEFWYELNELKKRKGALE